MSLVEITAADGVHIDLAYASEHNFTGRPVYAAGHCFLHTDAADHLRRAIALAAAIGLSLHLFDAFRPTEAQWILWQHTPDPEFLADPRIGSPHSRGVAVDLTLVDAAGVALEMGTAFDAFTPLSHHATIDIPPTAQRNRLILLGLMTAAGWRHYTAEWWHYQLPDSGRYPLLGNSAAPRPLMAAAATDAGRSSVNQTLAGPSS